MQGYTRLTAEADRLENAASVISRLDAAYPVVKDDIQVATLVGRALLEAHVDAGAMAEANAFIDQWLANREALSAAGQHLRVRLGASGLACLEMNDLERAEAFLAECLAINEKRFPDRWQTFNVTSLLGEALLGQEKYAEAEPLLISGYEGMIERQAKISPPHWSKLTDALDRLVKFYEARGEQGDAEKAAQWNAELTTAKDKHGRKTEQ